MNDFLIYALKSIMAFALFALAYRLAFINEGNLIIRRIYLLASASLALILPFIEFRLAFIDYKLPSVVLDEVIVYSNGIRLIKDTSAFPLAKFIKTFYFLVAGFLIFRIIINTLIILHKAIRNKPDKSEQIRLFYLSDKNISYSFFRNIFIGETADSTERDKILAHEKVHSLQLHSIDVLFIEILTGLFWFNPLVWWFRKEIKNVHEYLADQGALETGFNRKEYQITILEHLIGSASLTITNNFNYSLIKNRIAMMNKEKNSRKNTWKVFLLLPVSILIAVAFACTEKNPAGSVISGSENSDIRKAYYEAEQMPSFPGGMDALRKFIATNINYPKEAIAKQIQGKVFVQFIVDEAGKVVTSSDDFRVFDNSKKNETSIIGEVKVVGYKPAEGSPTENMDEYIDLLKKEAVRVVSLLPNFEKPAIQNGTPVAVVFTIPISFALQ
jgi:hypothetical protein